MPPPLGLFNRSDQMPDETDPEKLSQALHNLSSELDSLYNEIEEFQNELNDKYPELALTQLSNKFRDISKEWMRHTQRKYKGHYLVLSRSKDRMSSAKRIAGTSESVSRLFEQYSKRPHTYSRVKSHLEIENLLIAIRNLQDFC